MNESLEKLLKLALENTSLKKELLATQNADDQLDSFCKIATENGCPITVGEIFTLNQTLCDNLLKSTNGGATYPIEDWADAYEMFMSALI
jgi:vacuolar-type H+-ATPase catalytic subunit A/Vma1